MQFYPPGWVSFENGISCDATKWCAAMAIFSFNSNQNTGVANNADCLGSVGIEPANFAFITRNGNPIGPPGPVTLAIQRAYLDTVRGMSERWPHWLEYASVTREPAEA